MKKLILLFVAVIITSVIAKERTLIEKNKIAITEKKAEPKFIKVKATYYNPVEAQCDSTPLITASNSKINLQKLKNKKIRWIACSRDLLKRWGGNLKYGDKVYIDSKNKNVRGYWIVKDSMNKRYKKRIDFLCYDKIQGSLSDVKIRKVKN